MKSKGSQSEAPPRPAASAAPGNILETHTLWVSILDTVNHKLNFGPNNLCFNSPPGDSDEH